MNTTITTVAGLLVLAMVFLTPTVLEWLKERRQQTLDHEARQRQQTLDYEAKMAQIEAARDHTAPIPKTPPAQAGAGEPSAWGG